MIIAKDYWNRVYLTGREVYQNRTLLNVDEQAGPAYFEGLWLSRWLFWRRLRLAVQDVPKTPMGVAIDFGCGFGLVLPAMRENFARTLGIDLVPELGQKLVERWDEDHTDARNQMERGSLKIGDPSELSKISDASVDVILALDVLEHFKSLDEVLSEFHRLLSPKGTLIVSGPTENGMYQLGRKIVGFSGDYHHQDIYSVRAHLEKRFHVCLRRRIPWYAPLFHVLHATKRP